MPEVSETLVLAVTPNRFRILAVSCDFTGKGERSQIQVVFQLVDKDGQDLPKGIRRACLGDRAIRITEDDKLTLPKVTGQDEEGEDIVENVIETDNQARIRIHTEIHAAAKCTDPVLLAKVLKHMSRKPVKAAAQQYVTDSEGDE